MRCRPGIFAANFRASILLFIKKSHFFDFNQAFVNLLHYKQKPVMKQSILQTLDETTEGLLQTISSFTPENFNKIPFENSWTAAQVADHILKSEIGMPQLLQSRTVVTEREPDAMVQQIKDVFLDYSTKMKAPDFLIPTNDPQHKNDMYAKIETERKAVKPVIEAIDLTLSYPDFPFPGGFGVLTGLEWVTFMNCHSKRHTHQMQVILEKLA